MGVQLGLHGITILTLEARRKYFDMCEVYKFMHDLYKTNKNVYFSQPGRSIRGHSLKIAKPYARTLVRANFFSHRVISQWNNLPEKTVSAPSLDAFKIRLRSLPIGIEG